MAAQKIDRVLVGEALVGDGNEVAHIDLIMGPRGSAAETAFCTTLTNQKVGDNALLALVRPNLMTKPATVMFNKVDIKNGDQAGKMFGPAQQGIGKAVIDSVKSGVIPKMRPPIFLYASVSSFIGKRRTTLKFRSGIIKRRRSRSSAPLKASHR